MVKSRPKGSSIHLLVACLLTKIFVIFQVIGCFKAFRGRKGIKVSADDVLKDEWAIVKVQQVRS